MKSIDTRISSCVTMPTLNRRQLLRQGAAMGLALTGAPLLGSGAFAAAETLVSTEAGRVRGAYLGGVHTFKGIPYGAPTGGEARFLPASKPAPWRGVRDANDYGAISYQFPPSRSPAYKPTKKVAPTVSSEYWAAFKGDSSGKAYEGENCLALNVWTKGLRDGKKRPVMVWLHGGGFRSGSGVIHGWDLAEGQDVVVVSINHRLHLLGHLYLADIAGEKYKDSGNVGMLDAVLALEWVRDNIKEFGGDPDNVTIFGESGGGQKVGVLMAMPAAKGLFHRAIIQSGPGGNMEGVEEAADYTRKLFDVLGLKPSEYRKLLEMPATELMAAADKVPGGQSAMTCRPVVDGGALPTHPFDPVAPAISADIPLMIGFNQYEWTVMGYYSGLNDAFSRTGTIPENQLHIEIKKFLEIEGTKVDMHHVEALVARHRKHYPDASAYDTFFWILSTYVYRPRSQEIADRKAAQGGASVYQYMFAWETPAFGGVLRTPHAMEIPFVFDAADKLNPIFTEGDPQVLALSKTMAKAWATFARTGHPGHAGLPDWPAYEVPDRKTMIFNYDSKVVSDPDGEEVRAMMSLPTYPFM